jgi:Rrf2 family iron-sulfur cluster assembly transcriptional regulator
MKLTTKGRFAVTALLDIALREHEGVVSLASICDRQHISLAYLEQLFVKLKRAGLVSGCRGAAGGYQLAKPAAEISVAHVVKAVDETVDSTQCGGHENCHPVDPEGLIKTRCMTHHLWVQLNQHVLDFLEKVSLQDLVDQQRRPCHSHKDRKLHDLRVHTNTEVSSC